MFDLDINEQNTLNILDNKDVLMEVHNEAKTYRPIKKSDDSWNMKVVYKENATCGLKCENIKALRAFFLQIMQLELLQRCSFNIKSGLNVM